jgi:hypothetical protein
MSTKTTFKRIALVAVMALGLGTVSTAPSNALVNTPSLTLAASTGTAIPGGTAATVATTVGFLAGAAADAVTTTAILTSAPTGNSAFPTWAVSTSATNATQGGSTTQTMTTTAVAAGAVSHVANLTIGSNSNPLIAGVYVVTVTQGSLSATWTLTVAAAAGATAAASRVYMSSTALNATSNEATAQLLSDGTYTTKPTYTTATTTLVSEATVRAALVTHVAAEDADSNNVTSLGVPVGTAGATSWASLGVIVANGTSLATSTITSAVQQVSPPTFNPSASYPFNAAGYPVTVSISGPGWVSYAGVIRGKSYTELSTDGQVNYLQRSFGIISDGTTGTSTITVSQGATVLATRTIVSHGAVATVTLTASKNGSVLPIAGNTAGGGNLLNTVDAATIKVADAAGNPVPGQAVYLVSSDLTVYNLDYTLAGTTDVTGSITVSSMNSGIKAGAFTVTATTNATSAATTGKSSSPVSFRVSDGKPTLVKLTINGSSNAEVTRTGRWTSVVALSNAAGPLPAGCYQVATNPTTPNEDGYLQAIYQGISGERYGMWWDQQVCVDADGLYRNANSGYYLAESSGPAVRIAAGSGITGITFDIATITVTGDAAVAAATDAAAEATDAANAATDAANAAAEAADAATAAAQDAADAVAALSTQVSEMIDALKKQITALTNLVIKIQKKVKA